MNSAKSAEGPLIVERADNDASSTKQRHRRCLFRQEHAWQKTVSVGGCIAASVLLVNVGFFAWVVHLSSSDGTATIFDGSCDTSKRVTLWTDLVVNILSTLLLGASNNCSQLLSSPTRGEVDMAHCKGIWLDIGVPSVRNLSFIPILRRALWAILFLSSIPLHLLYNSVVFSTLSANDYQASIVSESFLGGAGFNHTIVEHIWGGTTQVLLSMQSSLGSLETLSNADCIKAYGSSPFVSDWKNVLLVTSTTFENNSVLATISHSTDSPRPDQGWVCQNNTLSRMGAIASPCQNIQQVLYDSDNWHIWGFPLCQSYPLSHVTLQDGSDLSIIREGVGCQDTSVPIKYCLAEPFEPHCTVKASLALLIVVILCNLAKLICLIVIASSLDFAPLATIGDAICSFIAEPDPTTSMTGPMSIHSIRALAKPSHRLRLTKKQARQAFSTGSRVFDGESYDLLDYVDSSQRTTVNGANVPGYPTLGNISHVYFCRNYRWFRSAGTTRWSIGLALMCVVWITAAILLKMGLQAQLLSTSALWNQGLGAIEANNIIGSPAGSLVSNVLLANTPQIIVSFVYLFYNNIVTCMVLAHEYTGFAAERKTLRVSHPRGRQRSTYWLQLPYKYIIPMMSSMMLLHWLISRSIFLVQISVYDAEGNQDAGATISGCGYSVPSITLAVTLGGLMIVALVVLACRKLNTGMPNAGNCSLAISAACHANPKGLDMVNLPLQYGVVPELGEDAKGRQRVGFSSRQVNSLVSGVEYL